ncbi:MmcQ/YjbR family DNA-binding protein [Chitinimonas sp.]|uniref:MmcQ/YjbR family DNA-binding protein n=1 Tax=Chitinimonas sp. TaxID=1934313 RepID=UPI002F937963
MDVEALQQFCARFPGATVKTWGPPGNVLVYSVGGKEFAYFKLSDPERWRFSFRATPERFLELTDVPGVKPARYRGRYHWLTIVTVATFPEDYLQELVAWSYRKALHSLSKRAQATITAG